MRANNGRTKFHSGRHDRDHGAGRGTRRSQIDWLQAASAQDEEREYRREAQEAEKFRRAQIGIAEAAAGHKSLDELHPRDAEEKT